jgi:hypothetical protein
VFGHRTWTSVLRRLQRRDITPTDAQRWASSVRRGYVAGVHDGPVLPLDITYEAQYEDRIVEVLARLEEIGDAVDGALSDADVQHLIHSLL